MTDEERIVQREQTIQQYCNEWQELLSLNEWDIHIHVYNKENPSFEEMRSRILRNTGYAYLPFPDEPLDLTALVYWLLQIRFEMVNNELGGNEIYYQRALHILATTLIKLKTDADNYKSLIKEFNDMYGGKDQDDAKQEEKIESKTRRPVPANNGIKTVQQVQKIPKIIE